jgi:hypothetical protein
LTHAEDTALDREHGIRSQWDAYAGLEGYCLVFDIATIAQMLKQEGEGRYWMWLMLEPVRYADRPVEKIFPELVLALADTLRKFLVDRVREPEMGMPEFLRGTTLLKGAPYKSEREVRIVAIPGTVNTAKYAAKEYLDQFDATAPLPEIRPRPKQGRAKAPKIFSGWEVQEGKPIVSEALQAQMQSRTDWGNLLPPPPPPRPENLSPPPPASVTPAVLAPDW